MSYRSRLTSSAKQGRNSAGKPSLARWLFLGFVLMIGSSQALMFGLLFYREYHKSREAKVRLLKERVEFILVKNEAGRLAGDYGNLTRSLYELGGMDSVTVLDKACGILSSAPLNTSPPKNCRDETSGWTYISFDDPYSEVAGVGIRQRGSVLSDTWKAFLASCLLFVFYAALLSLFLLVWLRRYFVRQVKDVVESIRSLGRGESGAYIAPERYPAELVPLYEALTLTVQDLEEAQRKIRKQSHMEAVGQVAAEVSHDIRSPLAILTSLSGKLGVGVPTPEERALLTSAIARIEQIAEDLLSENRAAGRLAKESASQLSCAELATVLQSLAFEKRAEFEGLQNIEISCRTASPGSSMNVRAEPVELKRVLSNLVNNSVEAMGSSGRVLLDLKEHPRGVCIEIADTGRGLSEEDMDRVWNRGESVGKKDGNAIGLARARRMIALWGGCMELRSSLGQGTVVTIELPAVRESSAGGITSDVEIVLIDDDALVRRSWEAAAQAQGVRLMTFSSPEEFWISAPQLSRSSAVYVDARLGVGVDGVELSRQIHESGFARVYLCTGDPSSKFRGVPFLAGVVGKEFPVS